MSDTGRKCQTQLGNPDLPVTNSQIASDRRKVAFFHKLVGQSQNNSDRLKLRAATHAPECFLDVSQPVYFRFALSLSLFCGENESDFWFRARPLPRIMTRRKKKTNIIPPQFTSFATQSDREKGKSWRNCKMKKSCCKSRPQRAL